MLLRRALPWIPALGVLAGCADLSYRNLQLGQSRTHYDGALPVDSSRRTDLGLCQYRKNVLGDVEAVVVLLSSDRRIAVKIRATSTRRNYGLHTESRYQLTGELDRRLYGTEDTGPIDTLRSVAHTLSERQSDALAREAHEFIAAGLARLLARWPGVSDVGIEGVRLEEFADKGPPGGAARIGVGADGILRFEYEQTIAR